MISLVLLPGLDGTGDLLAPLADRLSPDQRVQIISYPSDVPLGYDELTDLVCKRLPDEPFVILGESFSGPIAVRISAAQRDLVAGLVLVASFVRHPIPRVVAPLISMFEPTWVPRFLIEAVLLGSQGSPALKTELARAIAGVSRKTLKKRIFEVSQVDVRYQLSQVTCPVLSLQGRFDRLIGNRSVEEILSIQPDCTVRRFDAPHLLLQTHAEETAKAIQGFCEGLG